MTNTNEKSFQERDRLERKSLVDKICYLVDNLPKDDHFCLALNGEWGSGKTFVLNMLEEEFSKHEEYFVVKYDAWKNSFYHDPLIAILYSIIDSLKEQLDLAEDERRKCERVLKKLFKDVKKAWDQKIKKKVMELPEFRAAYMGYCVVRCLYELTKTAKFDLHKHQKFEDFVSYQSLLKDIQKVLNDFTEYKFCYGKQTKLIILVDEIDRCLPNEQLVILERLHHLFVIKNCAVIVAINKSTIASAFHIQQGCDGKEYLKKFFQHNFYVEPLWHNLLKKQLLDVVEDYFKTHNLTKPVPIDDINFVSNHVYGYCVQIEQLSRGKKIFENRLINEYLLKVRMVLFKQSAEKMGYLYLWLICTMMLYRTLSKEYYRELYIGKEGSKYVDFVNLNKDVFGTNAIIGNTISAYDEHGAYNRYTMYVDKRHNAVNYLYNYLRTRKTEYVRSIHSVFYTGGLHGAFNEEEVEQILNEIDKYSE